MMAHAKKKSKSKGKKSKKPKKVKVLEEKDYPKVSSHRRQQEFLPEYYCATCLILVQKLKYSLSSRKSEHDHYDAIDTLCEFVG